MPRRPPDIPTLLELLDQHGVRHVVIGSSAALLRGVGLDPGDLDVTPALDRENLERLAAVLDRIGARPDPAGFGRWEDGRWVPRDPTPEELAARPDPADPGSFDHLYESAYGAFDVVPSLAGTYEELRARAVKVGGVWIASLEDALATTRKHAPQLRQAMVSRTIGRGSGGSSPSS